MAKYSSADVGVYLVGGYDVLGVQTTLRIITSLLTEESDGLGAAWVAHESLKLRRASIAQEGFFDDAAGGNNDALLASVGTARVLTVGLEGNTFGKRFVGFSGVLQADYERIVARGALHKAKALHEGVGVVEEGLILHVHQAETADPFTGTSHDNGASSANGGSGYLEVSALTLGGFTDVLVKIRHSTDNVAFSDLITFAAVTAAPTAERKTVAGTINRYTRVEHDFEGAGAGQSVKYMVGFVRN